MKIPQAPPNHDNFIREALHHNSEQFVRVFTAAHGPLVDGHYTHWDKFRYRQPPSDLTIEEWWQALKYRRRSLYRRLPLKDKTGNHFVYLMADPSPQALHKIDLGSGGLIQMPDQITNPATRDQYYVGSLIDEAITSSQLEGA